MAYTVFWILIRNAHFELKFERLYCGPCVRQITSRCTEMRISNDVPEVFSSYASRKSRSEITVWMPWPLNRDLGGRAKWPSNHFRLYTARCIIYVQKHRKCELHACLIGRVPRHSPAGLQNPKFGLSCVHCVIQISQVLLSCVHCVIQNAHFELNSKYALCRRVNTV